MQVVTLATRRLLPQARVLARSLQRHASDRPLRVVLIGHGGPQPAESEPFVLSRAEDELELDIADLISRYSEDELITLLVPRILQAVTRDSPEAALHLPATAWVLDDLAPLLALVGDRGVVLAPRLVGELPSDGLQPTPKQLSTAGRVATDLMAVDGSAQADTFLHWWIARLDDSFGSPDGRSGSARVEDRFWARRFLELAPARFLTGTLDDPGLYVSLWNLHQQPLRQEGERVLVDGRWPLRLMDLPGFDPERPHRLAPSASRARVSRSPALRGLAARYADELLQSGWSELAGLRREVGRTLANGLVFDQSMWALSVQAQTLGEDFGDLFTAQGTAAFMRWLRAPAPRGAAYGINRYVFHRVALERPDVLRAYPDLDGADGAEYVAWCGSFGRSELGIPQAFLPGGDGEPPEADGPRGLPPDTGPSAAAVAVARASALGNGAAPTPADAGDTAAGRADVPAGESVLATDGAPIGVRVTGYLGHTLGLGSAARGYVDALTAAGVAVSTVTVPLHHLELPVALAQGYGQQAYDDVVHDGGHAFEVIAVNADELPPFVERLGSDYFHGPRIGIWGWEVNRIPERWQRAFELIDEIWVYSRFMAENIGAVAPVPVTVLPPPVEAPPAALAPLRLDLPDGYLFLFMFDYLSTTQRKNPVGLIEAFRRAFEPGEGPQMLLKTINAPLRPLAEEELLWAAHGRDDIHVIDRSLSAAEKDALVAGCDCYVSLHRSEGFGLTMAEAMAVGKPVIATGYSGNVDFMTPENSYLVDYEIGRVGPDCEIYPADGEWAEPDLVQAARLMRHVHEHAAEAAGVGERARADIARLLSREATGRAMRDRLVALSAGRPVVAR